jgi:hypothetical protein
MKEEMSKEKSSHAPNGQTRSLKVFPSIEIGISKRERC